MALKTKTITFQSSAKFYNISFLLTSHPLSTNTMVLIPSSTNKRALPLNRTFILQNNAMTDILVRNQVIFYFYSPKIHQCLRMNIQINGGKKECCKRKTSQNNHTLIPLSYIVLLDKPFVAHANNRNSRNVLSCFRSILRLRLKFIKLPSEPVQWLSFLIYPVNISLEHWNE